MSENLDLVRSIVEEWERGEYFGDDGEWIDPEIEFNIADGPEPGIRIGVVAMGRSWQGWLKAWEDFRLVAEEYRELDDGRVLVLNHNSGRGKTSGLDIGETWTKGATLFYIRGGKVTKLVGYNDRGRALADLGLEE